MRRTVFTLIGLSVLMCFPFVSCEDKLTDDKKNSGEEIEGEGSYKTVQDSVFFYSNGKLQRVQYQFFDSIGNIIRGLNKSYDNYGSLILNSETNYIYSDADRRNYTSYTNNHGLSCDRKVEFNINNVNRTQKEYVNYGGEWLLVRENISQRDRNAVVSKTISYGLYNNNLIVLSRSESKTTYNSVTGVISGQETDSYKSNYRASGSNSDITIIDAILSESWTREIGNYDSDGRQLNYLKMKSSDSIDWKEEGKSEYKYDSNGNEIEYLYEESMRHLSMHYLWTYDNENKLLKEEYYEWSETKRNYILFCNANYSYTYSASGVLAAVEINSESNCISLPIVIHDGRIRSNFSGALRTTSAIPSTSTYAPAGAKCSIICDSNGNPASETLYRLDSEGKMVEYGKCTLEYDSKGICLNWNYEIGDDYNDYKEERTNDSRGNLLTSYNYNHIFDSISDTYNTPNGSFTITHSHERETESRQENRYNELGFISYSFSSSKNYTHIYDYSDGREDMENNSESRQEVYYSTIKVK